MTRHEADEAAVRALRYPVPSTYKLELPARGAPLRCGSRDDFNPLGSLLAGARSCTGRGSGPAAKPGLIARVDEVAEPARASALRPPPLPTSASHLLPHVWGGIVVSLYLGAWFLIGWFFCGLVTGLSRLMLAGSWGLAAAGKVISGVQNP